MPSFSFVYLSVESIFICFGVAILREVIAL